MFERVKAGDSVLLLWADLGSSSDMFQAVVTSVKEAAGPGGRVCVENRERLSLSAHPASSFSLIFSGCLGLASVSHDLDTLASLTRLLRPGGHLLITQLLPSDQDPASITSGLVLAGLTAQGPPQPLQTLPSLEESLAKLNMTSGTAYQVVASKPNHEVGASRLLSFAKPAAPVKAAPKADVWTLEDIEDDTVELMDDSELLNEEDLVKPDPASLRVCGTTGKRKACKDCSCGLKEELEDGKEPTKKDFTSSCGSCFLGDAFRCGSCPYLGMPAFNPGDKITLSQRQLNPDLNEIKA